jgi:hypothetical protein
LNQDLLSEVGLVEKETIVAFRNLEPQRVVFQGKPTVRNVMNFVRANRRPLVMKMGAKSDAVTREEGRISCLLFRNKNETDEASNQ